MLNSFYDWTSRVYWGSQPVAWYDELLWLAMGLSLAMSILLTAWRWLPSVARIAAAIAAIMIGVFVSFAPIKHAQRFVECAYTKHIISIEGVEREMIVKKCRTRATLDGEWSDWQWRGATVE